jgi:hypothetical protein
MRADEVIYSRCRRRDAKLTHLLTRIAKDV